MANTFNEELKKSYGFSFFFFFPSDHSKLKLNFFSPNAVMPRKRVLHTFLLLHCKREGRATEVWV